MNSKNLLWFCGGMVLGSLGTIAFLWFWQEEPEKTSYIPETEEPSEEPSQEIRPVDKSTLDDIFEQEPAVNYNAIVEHLYGDKEGIVSSTDDPKRITDADFQTLVYDGHYDTRELTLYSDGILANATTDEVMSESDAFVALGPNYTGDHLTRIFARGANNDLDQLFIRNDRLYTLYEITFDGRTYKEVVGGD